MSARNREEIKRYLIRRDRALRPVITQLNFPVARRNRDIYATLLRSIIAQQLSVRAADTIHARFLALFDDAYLDPATLCRMPVTRLRAAGLSRRKSDYLKAVAHYALEEGMDYASLAKYSDAQIIDQLTQIHGVGRWTVEMLLIFSFQRHDIFAVDDVGIQNAMQRLYGLEHSGKALKQAMHTIAERWQPYRSIVCKYLWQWKNQPGAQA
jgi:DNA-3-methyladenine glycosylase II